MVLHYRTGFKHSSREKTSQMIQQYHSKVQTFRVLKRTSDHKRYFPPRTSTCRECASSRRQPSLNRQYPLQEQGRLRVVYKTRTESYAVLLYCLQQYKGYTTNSAYHNVVVEEGWASHKDVSRKQESSVEFLPSSCSLHCSLRQPFVPNFQ